MSDADLPRGYRWATYVESELYAADHNNLAGAVLVKLSLDSTGAPYGQDEADLAVPKAKTKGQRLYLLRSIASVVDGRRGVPYDTTDALIIRAGSPRAARLMAQERVTSEWQYPFFQELDMTEQEAIKAETGPNSKGFWLNPQETTCEELHVSGKAEVILSSYNAG
jgi:hypothetical protein